MDNLTCRILLVEDNEDDYLIVRDVLRDIATTEFDLQWVDNYQAGRESLAHHHYDVCLIDYRLGEATGVDLVREYGRGETPFILLTGNEDYEADVAATKAGAMDYLVKGHINAPLLERSIRYAIARKRTEVQLRASEASLATAQQIAHLGSWEWDLTPSEEWCGNPVRWSDEAFHIFGYAPGEVEASYENFLRLIHPDDRARMEATANRSLREGTGYSLEHRLIRPDGTECIVQEEAKFIFNASGKPIKMVGSVQDITERKQAEAALQESQMQLRAVIQSLDDIVFEFDRHGTYINVWSSSEALLARPKTELIGRSAVEVLGQATAEPFVAAFGRVLDSGQMEDMEYELEVMAGKRYFQARISPIPAPDGSAKTVSMLSRDITERKQAEESLRHSEERYRSLTLATSQIVWTAAADAMLGDMPAWNEFTGQSVEESQGWGWAQALHPDDLEKTQKKWADCLETGSFYETEYRIRGADGGYRLFIVRGVPIFKDDGSIREWVGTLTDIHDHRQAEEERDRFFTLSLDMLAIIGSDGYFKRLNPAFETTLGFTNAELMAVPFLDFVHPDDIAATLEGMAKLAGGTQVVLENRYRCRDGSYKWLQWMAAPFEELWYCVAHDVTGDKEAAAALRESEERFRQMSESVDEVFWLFDPVEAKLLYVSPAYESVWGRSCQSLLDHSMNFIDTVHPDDRNRILAALEHQGKPNGYSEEHRIVRPDGSVRWVWARTYPIYNEKGEVYRIAGIAQDIEARKRAETALHKANDELELNVMERTAELNLATEALYKNHEFLEAVLENTAEGIVACDADGQLTFFNRATREFHGLPLELLPVDQWSQHYSLYLADGVTPMQMEDVPLCRALRGDHVRDVEMVIAPGEGSPRLVTNNGEPLFGADGEKLGAVVVMHDITERRQAEASLRMSEEKYRVLWAGAGDAFVLFDSDSKILEANAAVATIFGYQPEEVIGQNLSLLQPEQFREGHRQGLQRYLATGVKTFNWRAAEVLGLHRDGREFPIEIAFNHLHLDGKDLFAGFIRDTTQRKQAEVELQRAKEEAERANLAKSEFLSRMSHELRTPLNAILGFGQILEMQNLKPLGSESIDHILRGGRHLLALINEVLDIARVEAGSMELSLEPVAVREIVHEAASLIRPLAGQNGIRLDLFTTALCEAYVLADQQRLKQVLINLLSNAVKYNSHGGSVTTSCAESAAGRIRIGVSDTGPGIAAPDLEKLFVPFERLGAEKTEIEGTGLGLAFSRRLVEAMNGTLSVASVLGQGSTFTVELPRAQAPAPPEAAPGNAASPEAKACPGTTKTVLSIEDNASNYRLIETILASRPGLKLLGAMQGGVGLDLALQHHPDLILLDLHLPDIMGHEVLRRLRAAASTQDIPVVILSADATESQIERLLAAGATAYLTKPLDVAEFLGVLDEMLKDEDSQDKNPQKGGV